jgi:Lysylphosphatidylglycerol synthase TM region
MPEHHRRARWVSRAVLLGGIALLVLLFVRLGPGQILGLIAAIGWNFAMIIAIFAGHECMRALAVRRCLIGEPPRFGRLLQIRFLGEGLRTLTYTGPFLSEPARAWLLARQGLESSHAYGAAVSELIANSAISALVAGLTLAFVLVTVELSRPLAILANVLAWTSLAYVLIVAVALARRVYVIGTLARGIAALPIVGRRFATNPASIRRMEDAIMHVLRDRPAILAQVVLLQFIAQALLVFDVYWTIRSMGVSRSFGTALIVEALTKLANLIQFVGASEGSYALVFEWLGMTAASGFTMSIVKRVRSLAVAAIGLLLLSDAMRDGYRKSLPNSRRTGASS